MISPIYEPSECVGTKPEETDGTTSPTTVFLREDFSSSPAKDMEGKETGETVWTYQEARVTRAQYAQMLAEKNAATTAYLAMMTDVEV